VCVCVTNLQKSVELIENVTVHRSLAFRGVCAKLIFF
jgi:hypothetical protein